MKATNINWDVDNEEDLETLPTEIELPKGMTNEDEISDYISDKTGFCHLGFVLENEDEKAIELIKNNEKETLTLYDMRLTFSLDLGLKDINSIAKSAGIHEKMLVRNAQKMKLTQTVPFIPNEEILQEYADVIKNNYQSESFTCEACYFVGYDYIRPKTLLETGEIK